MTDETQLRLELRVRQTNGTYLARFQGKTATCTAGAIQAAQAVLRKAYGADFVAGLAFEVSVYTLTLSTVTVTKAVRS